MQHCFIGKNKIFSCSPFTTVHSAEALYINKCSSNGDVEFRQMNAYASVTASLIHMKSELLKIIIFWDFLLIFLLLRYGKICTEALKTIDDYRQQKYRFHYLFTLTFIWTCHNSYHELSVSLHFSSRY